MDYAWIEWTDHALIVMECTSLTAIKPEMAYDRREIEEAWKDRDLVLKVLNSSFPFTSAEEAVAERVQKQPQIRGIRSFSDTLEDLTADDLKRESECLREIKNI